MKYFAVAADLRREKRELRGDFDGEVYGSRVLWGQDETGFADIAFNFRVPGEMYVGIGFCLGFVNILQETLLVRQVWF